jgi:hypothetical protein
VRDIVKISTDLDSVHQRLCPQEIFQENISPTLSQLENPKTRKCKFLRTGKKSQLQIFRFVRLPPKAIF